VLGLVSGITMSIGTFLITQMYEGPSARFTSAVHRLLLQHGGDDLSDRRRLPAGAQRGVVLGLRPALA
jgi:hypothetical protein